jgi:hypothetical protein
MANLPEALAIALWITGSCWAVAALAYVSGASTEWVLPLFFFGCVTGVVEWIKRRMPD